MENKEKDAERAAYFEECEILAHQERYSRGYSDALAGKGRLSCWGDPIAQRGYDAAKQTQARWLWTAKQWHGGEKRISPSE